MAYDPTSRSSFGKRDDQGTHDDFMDDQGAEILATEQFTSASSGELIGGSRFKELTQSLDVEPGSYTIVARGYSQAERNGNSGNKDEPFGMLTDSSAISFQGSSRFGLADEGFPEFVSLGPANRFGAGTFAFLDSEPTEIEADPPQDQPVIAYQTLPGNGNANFDGTLGMDFQVHKPIVVSDLGVFDSGQDGIRGTVATSLWLLGGAEQSTRRVGDVYGG